jgi:O6-methylguanine-DNA--protein-cysteine methyltransferase
MSLVISNAAFQAAPAATAANVSVDILSSASGECALGQVLVARGRKGVCAILMGDDHHELEADLAARFPRATLVGDEAAVHDDLAKVIRFVEKPAEGLHLKLDMRGRSCTQSVLVGR